MNERDKRYDVWAGILLGHLYTGAIVFFAFGVGIWHIRLPF